MLRQTLRLEHVPTVPRDRYTLWVDFYDGRPKVKEVYALPQAETAQLRFAEFCGQAGVDHVLLHFNDYVVDSWGT